MYDMFTNLIYTEEVGVFARSRKIPQRQTKSLVRMTLCCGLLFVVAGVGVPAKQPSACVLHTDFVRIVLRRVGVVIQAVSDSYENNPWEKAVARQEKVILFSKINCSIKISDTLRVGVWARRRRNS